MKAANIVKKVKAGDVVQQMLQHFETHNFLRVSNERIQLGFNANNLKDAVRKEWLLTNFVSCDQPVFQFGCLKAEANFKSAFDSVRNFVCDVPFSLIETYTEVEENPPKSSNSVDLFRHYFKRQGETVLKSLTFCSPTAATETFLKQQRERKIWYRKFSALPGRFHLTATNTDNTNKSQFVEIQAEFPWGLETIETIKYFPEFCTADSNFFQIKHQRKKILPQVVTCEARLENLAFLFLCDSYEGINEEEVDRNMLRFSRKLAPYKIAFAGEGKSLENIQNLKELALLLSKKLRKCNIPVLLLPDMNSDLERQMLRNDGLGIPYTVILNEQTLKDGILEIRSRDTTLKELEGKMIATLIQAKRELEGKQKYQEPQDNEKKCDWGNPLHNQVTTGYNTTLA